MELVEIIKALGDETRLRIVNLLTKGELCVCEIEKVLVVTQSNASRHLAKLKSAGLIVGKKKAQWVYYSLNEALIKDHSFIKELIETELVKINQYQDDLSKLTEVTEC